MFINNLKHPELCYIMFILQQIKYSKDPEADKFLNEC